MWIENEQNLTEFLLNEKAKETSRSKLLAILQNFLQQTHPISSGMIFPRWKLDTTISQISFKLISKCYCKNIRWPLINSRTLISLFCFASTRNIETWADGIPRNVSVPDIAISMFWQILTFFHEQKTKTFQYNKDEKIHEYILIKISYLISTRKLFTLRFHFEIRN